METKPNDQKGGTPAVASSDLLGELMERRAKFVYDAARLAAQAAKAPIVPAPWDEREEPFKAQFRKVIERQCGEHRSRSPEELHGSWMQAHFAMGWKYGDTYSHEEKTHPDLVPYADLGQLERDKDAVFVALCEIARQWVYSPNTELSGGGPLSNNNKPSGLPAVRCSDWFGMKMPKISLAASLAAMIYGAFVFIAVPVAVLAVAVDWMWKCRQKLISNSEVSGGAKTQDV